MNFVVYALGAVALAAMGQLLLKLGLVPSGDAGAATILGNVISQLLKSPLLWGGLVCYGASTLLWMMALSSTQLNRLYPFTALTFATVMVLSSLVLKEPISWVSLIGVVIVVGGLYLVVRG